MIKILGNGYVLVGVSVQLDSEELHSELQLSKGGMTQIDEMHAQRMLQAMQPYASTLSAGGGCYTHNGHPARR